MTNRLLKLIVVNDKYPFELLMCKFFEYSIWKKINLSELHDILIRNLDLTNEGTEDFESIFILTLHNLYINRDLQIF